MDKLLLVLLLVSACNNQSRLDIYRDSTIQPAVYGEIEKTELWRGGSLVIYLDETNANRGRFQIRNYRNVLDEIQPGLRFKKIPNSNKCMIFTSDSLFCFDCIALIREKESIRDSLKAVSQWGRDSVDKWQSRR